MRILLLPLVIGLASAATADAQLLADPPSGQAMRALPAPGLLSAGAQAQLGAARPGGASLRRAMFTASGALLGAGVGFLVSQVAYSDWDKVTNSTFAQQRLTFALSGAAVGAATGLVFGARTEPPLEDGVIYTRAREVSASSLISLEEIQRTTATTALDLVQSLRPNWLLGRGVQRFRESGRVQGTERGITVTAQGEPGILVYLDQAKLGGLETLRQVPAATVHAVHRLSAAEANYRWGEGHTHGVILLESVGRAGDTATPP